jgi:hypothetical protein
MLIEDVSALGLDAAPHSVIVRPDRAARVTKGGQNALISLGFRITV